jgi:hypothetical protein
MAGLLMLNNRSRGTESRPPPFAMDLGSDIGDNKAIGGGYVGVLPASLGTQMAYATEALRADSRGDGDRDMFGRLMLARMNNLEAGFREVVREMRSHLHHEEKRSRSHDPRGRAPRSHGKVTEKGAGTEKSSGDERKEELKPGNWQSQAQRADEGNGNEGTDEDLDGGPKKGGSV